MRIAGLALAGAAAASLSGLPFLGSDTAARQASEDLPWPYCAPDATPPPAPPPPPGPPLPPEIAGDAALGSVPDASLIDALVVPSAIDLVEETKANVSIGEIVWQTAWPPKAVGDLYPFVQETVPVWGEHQIWIDAVETLTSGSSRVVLGVYLYPHERGPFYALSFAADMSPQAPAYLGIPDPFGAAATAQVRAFLQWEGNPMQGTDPLSFLIAWAAEADAPGTRPTVGPIALSWERFWDQFQSRDYPQPGSMEWWVKAPPECRSMMDAPAEVAEGLKQARIWVRVPEPWQRLPDGVLCIRVPSLGTSGCAAPSTVVAPSFPYVLFNDWVYTVPGEPLLVSVFRVLPGGVSSNVQSVVVAHIPYQDFLTTGILMVELHPERVPASYADLAADPHATWATFRPISQEEDDTLQEQWPALEPCSAEAACN